jgi:hypothetical protein
MRLIVILPAVVYKLSVSIAMRALMDERQFQQEVPARGFSESLLNRLWDSVCVFLGSFVVGAYSLGGNTGLPNLPFPSLRLQHNQPFYHLNLLSLSPVTHFPSLVSACYCQYTLFHQQSLLNLPLMPGRRGSGAYWRRRRGRGKDCSTGDDRARNEGPHNSLYEALLTESHASVADPVSASCGRGSRALQMRGVHRGRNTSGRGHPR